MPKLLLALVAVLDYSSRDSLKILFTQPALILLPVFTPFTFSRISRADNRVKLSAPLTFINIGITFAGFVWFSVYAALSGLNIIIIIVLILVFVPTVCNTVRTLCFRGLSPCYNNDILPCDISVFDPAQPGKHFLLNTAGNIVEKTDNDEEANSEDQQVRQ